MTPNTALPSWPVGPATARAEAGTVHLWLAELTLPEGAPLESWARLLSDVERERAGHFRFERDRRWFVLRRSWLRVLLARYLDRDPGSLGFVQGPHGKPSLRDLPKDLPLQFNASHARGVALYAVTLQHPVGVDLEWIHEVLQAPAIAARYFTPAEQAEWTAAPESDRMRMFLQIWTRVEARLKALGVGLAGLGESAATRADQCPLASAGQSQSAISASTVASPESTPAPPASQLESSTSPNKPALEWTMKDLDLGAALVGACAVRARGISFTCWRMAPPQLASA